MVCVDDATAAWCSRRIPLGHPGLVLSPLVLGPNLVPVVTDPDQASRSPELAVLSAMAHGDHPEQNQILRALTAALAIVDDDTSILYADVVLAALPSSARRSLEEFMRTRTHEYQSDFVRRYFYSGKAEGEAMGRAEGEANAVLGVLDARGVDVPEEARARILGCTDLDQLDAWIRRAASADSIKDVLD